MLQHLHTRQYLRAFWGSSDFRQAMHLGKCLRWGESSEFRLFLLLSPMSLPGLHDQGICLLTKEGTDWRNQLMGGSSRAEKAKTAITLARIAKEGLAGRTTGPSTIIRILTGVLHSGEAGHPCHHWADASWRPPEGSTRQSLGSTCLAPLRSHEVLRSACPRKKVHQDRNSLCSRGSCIKKSLRCQNHLLYESPFAEPVM